MLALLAGCLPVAQTTEPVPTSRAVLTLTPLTDAQVLAQANRPNFVFILTDDLDATLGTLDYMPKLQTLVTAQGLTMNDFFVSHSLCCPSRSTILRSQFTHNHGIYRNDPPYGGFEKFYAQKYETSTLATWLQAAGYRTVLLGKYLNGYPFREDRAYVPPGWSEWYSAVKGNAFAGFKYTLNENGTLVDYEELGQGGPSQYATDVLGNKAIDFIQRASADGVPFFMYLSTYAPHVPVKAAPRHVDLFPDIKAPRTVSFNEEDVSDKPASIQNDPQLSPEEIIELDEEYRGRLQVMQAVDEMIAGLVQTLQETGELDNTYIIFTSDNGYHLGQHRLRNGKGSPYEEDIRVPFIIRGPGIQAGAMLDGYLAGNVDIAPTIAELAGVTPPDYVEGRSMAGLLTGTMPAGWRDGYLLEFYGYNDANTTSDTPPPTPEFIGLRTLDYLYAEYADGFVELYDLKTDPYQMDNIASSSDPSLLAHLSAWLRAYAQCAADTCRLMDREPK